MGYQLAMESAGATVLAYERFGSYQGEWLAKVSYQGETFYVAGSYGSCSGCDAFESEVGYNMRGECEEHRYEGSRADCAACVAAGFDYKARLVAFGLSYLTDYRSKEELLKKFTEQSEWDQDAEEIVAWLNAN